jgi:hypothetical protein
MARDGSDNLRKNVNRQQFGLADPRHYGFAGDKSDVIGPRLDFDPYAGSKRSVRLDQPIFSTQDYVEPGKVTRFVEHPRSGVRRGSSPPLVVQHQGQLHVWDGHHRVAGALIRGQKTMTVLLSQTADQRSRGNPSAGGSK